MCRQDHDETGQERRSPAGARCRSVGGMNIELSHCFISVLDHDAALSFYRDALGLEVRYDVGYEGMRWVSVGPPSQPGIDIVLESAVADPGASPADRKVVEELIAKGLMRA